MFGLNVKCWGRDYIMKYFAYGSNMDLAQMKERCPDSQLIGKACLFGYHLMFNRYSSGWGCGVADIVPEIQSEVWGLLYEISDNDLENLDRYEGHPNLYQRIVVVVRGNNGDHEGVITYQVVKKGAFIPPSRKYLNIINKTAEDYQFPDGYKNLINKVSIKHEDVDLQ